MKSCCNSLHYIHLAAGTDRRAPSWCWKRTKPGASPSCLWARGGVHGTTKRSHSDPHWCSLISVRNNRRNTVKPVLLQWRLASPNSLLLIRSRLLTRCESTCPTVSHPRTQSQSWQQAVVYGMHLYKLWNLGSLQVVFSLLIRSPSKAAVIPGPLVGEQLSGNPKISHYEACAAWSGLLWRSAVVRSHCWKKFPLCITPTVKQATLASRSANQHSLNRPDLSVKRHLNINEKCPSFVCPLAVTLISLAVPIEHELGNGLTQQRNVHRKYKFFSRRRDSLDSKVI